MSPKQQLENSKIALRRWMEVPSENVFPELSDWSNEPSVTPHCGTVACFGGWLCVMPEFVAMGVTRDSCGAPTGLDSAYSSALSSTLFGAPDLFSYTQPHEHLTRQSDDHLVVQNRLTRNIARLQAELGVKS